MNITHHFDNILGRTGNWTGRVLIGCTNIPHKVDKKSYVTASFIQHILEKYVDCINTKYAMEIYGNY